MQKIAYICELGVSGRQCGEEANRQFITLTRVRLKSSRLNNNIKTLYMKTHYVIEILRKSIFICLYLTFSPALVAQQVVTGRITESVDGTPIPSVSIFIANTSIGTISNESGNYSITYQGKGSFEIVVSHVGYQPVFQKIDIPKPFHQIDVSMESNELSEVIITARSNYSRSDVNLFWRKLLGKTPSRNGMEVLNPEKVYFYRNSDNILKVSCKEPIEIINHEMGYHIRYILGSFQHDYREDVTTISGNPHFEELIPQNSRQKTNWEKKRQDVYDVSILRFIRALYRGQIHEKGFLLAEKDSLRNGKTVFLKDILQSVQDMILVSIEATMFLMCYSKPVTTQMIQNSYRYLVSGGTFPIVVELLPQQIIIYSDGTYSGTLQIQERRGYIFGLSSMVPVEYAEF